MKQIPPEFQDLLTDKVRAFVSLATIMNDGSPQVTTVWFDWDGENIWVNSARGRVKDRNMRSNPNVALTINDPKDPYRFIQIRGKVGEITEEGAWEHINKLSLKYRGKSFRQNPGEVRVSYKIIAEHVMTYGE